MSKMAQPMYGTHRRGQFVQIKVVGHHTFKAGLRRAQRRFERWAPRIVRAEAREVLKRALFYCPIDTGRLRSTGRLRGPSAALMKTGKYTVEIIFGGMRAPYGLTVHEDLRSRHAEPTQAKYLWRALSDRQHVMAAKMSARLRGAMR